MKILAMYLPQFHSIPENDEWWGEGFTEWTNTKKAVPLYKSHYQPKEPLNDYYYNLLDDDVKIWQAELAKKYGIYGFCYYHYWFNGKLLLEKPMEQMLKNKKIDIPFCISWANEPWARNWDGLENEVLMPQTYGSKKDWKKHFDYLLDFFKDERYIKIDNKPLVLIYRTNILDNYDEMFKYWIQLAKKNGFNGLSITETLSRFQKEPLSKYSDSVYFFEPSYTSTHNCNKINKAFIALKNLVPSLYEGKRYIRTNSYDFLWRKILSRNVQFKDKKVYNGAFVDWDNTSRKGTKGGIVVGGSPEKFEKYLEKLILKSENNSEFIFINAWNEWAEGTYLEPDKKNKYSYLEAIKKVVDKNDKE